MKQYFLSTHVHFCVTSDGAIFIDLRRGKYLGVEAADTALLQQVVHGWPTLSGTEASSGKPSDEIESLIRTLTDLNILTTDRRIGKEARPTDLSVESGLDLGGGRGQQRIRLREVFRVGRAFLSAALRLRLQSLEGVITHVERRNTLGRAAHTSSFQFVCERVHAFRRNRPLFFSSDGKCMFDSLALLEFLAEDNIYPHWIFAVKTRPFGAHSWVQYEGVVLNDDLGKVQMFRPLLAV